MRCFGLIACLLTGFKAVTRHVDHKTRSKCIILCTLCNVAGCDSFTTKGMNHLPRDLNCSFGGLNDWFQGKEQPEFLHPTKYQ